MTYEEARDLFRNDRNSFGQTRAPMRKIKEIYASLETQICDNCMHLDVSGYIPKCTAKNIELILSQSKHFGCNTEFKRKREQ